VRPVCNVILVGHFSVSNIVASDAQKPEQRRGRSRKILGFCLFANALGF